ncbi:hypothetical protein CIY_00230 [Butyrivibrio fibrisolvens 16/4]|nr:hypothetical protein CIY_00230 [Butyrivibrio fibrisolvens 16/4]
MVSNNIGNALKNTPW